MAQVNTLMRKPYLIYGALSLAVLLPLLLPGYILTLDMVFTPTLRMPETMSSSYLFHAALHYLDVVLPSQLIQKVMLFVILLLSGLGAYKLICYVQRTKKEQGAFDEWGAYIGGMLYMVNPFTYSRFMAGQYAVLLGYTLLPFFVRALLQFLAVPTLSRVAQLIGWTIAISIVSIHSLGLAAIVALCGAAVYAWRYRHNNAIVKAIGGYSLLAFVLFILCSGYWLFPLLAGDSNQGQAIRHFTSADQQAFATGGDSVAGKVSNVLQLQGFWAEGQGLYLLPAEQLPGWLVVVIGIWIVVAIGAVKFWKRQRALAAIVLGSGGIALVLAVTGLPGWGAFAGFREPQKFVGLVALAYAVCAGYGAAAILTWAKHKTTAAFALFATCVLLMPILFTPTMFFGFDGQLTARQYPADWFAVNAQLNNDHDDFETLFLPWHLYMHYPFAGRIIVSPAEDFFDKPVIASNELEFMGAAPTFPNSKKQLLTKTILPAAPNGAELGHELALLNCKYVLLAKTFDYQEYRYLDNQPDLRLVTETPNLKLYRNLAYGK